MRGFERTLGAVNTLRSCQILSLRCVARAFTIQRHIARNSLCYLRCPRPGGKPSVPKIFLCGRRNRPMWSLLSIQRAAFLRRFGPFGPVQSAGTIDDDAARRAFGQFCFVPHAMRLDPLALFAPAKSIHILTGMGHRTPTNRYVHELLPGTFCLVADYGTTHWAPEGGASFGETGLEIAGRIYQWKSN